MFTRSTRVLRGKSRAILVCLAFRTRTIDKTCHGALCVNSGGRRRETLPADRVAPDRSLESICLPRSHIHGDRINLCAPSIFLSSNLRWNIIIKIYIRRTALGTLSFAWRGEIYTFPRYNWAYQTHLVVTLYVMYHRLREWRREKRELFLRSRKMGFRLWASSPFNPFSYFMNHHKKLPSHWISTHPCNSERLHFPSCWNQDGLMRIKSDNVVSSALEWVTFEVAAVVCGSVFVIFRCKLKFIRLVLGSLQETSIKLDFRLEVM